jgi:hypothetical protein
MGYYVGFDDGVKYVSYKIFENFEFEESKKRKK